MHLQKLYIVLLSFFFSFILFSSFANKSDSLISAYKSVSKKDQIKWINKLVEADIKSEEKKKVLNFILEQNKNDKILKAKIYVTFGFLEEQNKKFPKAIEAYEKALFIQKESNQIALDTLVNQWKINLATVYQAIGDDQKAYVIFMEVLKNIEKDTDKNSKKELIADISKRIGDVHRNLKNEDKAIEYYQRALELYQELNIKQGKASTSNSLGILYSDQGNPQKALEFYRKTLQLCREIGYERGVSFTLNNIGYELFVLKNYDSAFYYYEDALKLKEELNNPSSMSATLVNMGQVRLVQEEYTAAKLLFQKSLDLAIKTENSSVELENYEYLTQLYQKIGKSDEALENLQKYVELKEVISEESKLEQINELEARFQAGKKQQQIDFLQQKSEWETGKSYLLGGVALLAIIVVFLAFRRIREKHKVNQLLGKKNNEVTTANQKVKESIVYAKHIQDAIQVNETQLFEYFPTHFILNRPRDIVGGDCLWFAQKEEVFYMALADCTGHGVSGAFMTILCNSLLNDIFKHNNSANNELNPAEILEKLDDLLEENLHQKQTQIMSGMDIAILKIDAKENKIVYAGAKIPLYYKLQNSKLISIKATRRPIGEQQFRHKRTNFKNHFLDIEKGMRIYLTSDGYQDQFGGAENKKFMRKNFEKLISTDIPISNQEKEVVDKLENWKGKEHQTDDIMVVGIEF
ncbi:tetratricopeptide repeat protein [Bernardetia sp. ABR2-2B]|uniref:tetratricopeptide repeat protein n=1 Tax=Bernardetia sp. ABR2-2B TaxID=3127472 RepID=UPI0030CE48B6